MKCDNCGQSVSEGARFCGSCGAPVAQQAVSSMAGPVSPLSKGPLAQPSPATYVSGFPAPIPEAPSQPLPESQVPGPSNPFAGQVSNKNYLTTFLLAYFLGWLGADRFYTGHIGGGILKLVTLGGCGVWSFIDALLVITGARKDRFGRTFYGRNKDFKLSLVVMIIFTTLGVLGVAYAGRVELRAHW